jgi:hypothetical protein
LPTKLLELSPRLRSSKIVIPGLWACSRFSTARPR